MKERAAPTKQDEQPNEDIIPYHQARVPYINYSNVATFLLFYDILSWSVVGCNDMMDF